MAFLESSYYKTVLKSGLTPRESSDYRNLFQVKTHLQVSDFVDGFFNPFSEEWYLLAELSDGSFAVHVEIMPRYPGSRPFSPIYSGAHLYHPCSKIDAERVLVDALIDYDENYAYDLENRFDAEENESEARKVRKKLGESKDYLLERLKGADERSARITAALLHLYD